MAADPKAGYVTWRAASASEDTQLTATTQDTAPALTDTDGYVIGLNGRQNGLVQVIFFGTAAADKTMAWTVWGYASLTDWAEYVAHGTATTGATTDGTDYYADTIVITDQGWIKSVYKVDGAPDTVVNGGGIAKLCFDSCEYPYFKLIIRDIAGGGAEAATAGAKYRLTY